jgi:hypothetical protein
MTGLATGKIYFNFYHACVEEDQLLMSYCTFVIAGTKLVKQ